jgi:hypothetical protein
VQKLTLHKLLHLRGVALDFLGQSLEEGVLRRWMKVRIKLIKPLPQKQELENAQTLKTVILIQ